jgi:hypothetical protein
MERLAGRQATKRAAVRKAEQLLKSDLLILSMIGALFHSRWFTRREKHRSHHSNIVGMVDEPPYWIEEEERMLNNVLRGFSKLIVIVE